MASTSARLHMAIDRLAVTTLLPAPGRGETTPTTQVGWRARSGSSEAARNWNDSADIVIGAARTASVGAPSCLKSGISANSGAPSTISASRAVTILGRNMATA